jgi:hypothetical protein
MHYLTQLKRMLIFAGSLMSIAPSSSGQIKVDLRSKDNATADNAHTFTISAEFRPRAEFRDGFKQLRNDTAAPAFFVSERSRINLGYETKNFTWYTSIQDVRVWGEDDPRGTDGTLQVFETWVEPSLAKNLSVRIGRQKIIYDNQRLFAENDWRQVAGSHDAIRFRFHPGSVNTELTLAFNQNKEQVYTTDFSPTTFTNYKFLAVHYFNYVHKKKWGFTTINAADGFQDPKYVEKMNMRYTSGGRIEYFSPAWYFTVSGYYQYGKNAKGTELAAYYFQPEIKFTGLKRFSARLGGQYISGNNASEASDKDHSFVPLYGVAHRFGGYMEYFTSYPGDVNNAGLINPYLYLSFDVKKTLAVKSDFHMFYSQNDFLYKKQVIDKYLGFENDLTLVYTPNSFTKLDFGFSWMAPTESMALIKKGGNYWQTPYWSYIMVTFKPELLKLIF